MEPILERGAWRAFKRHRRGYFSLLLLAFLFSASLLAPLWSNDKPLWLSYRGESYFPLLHTYHDRDFGGDFDTPADYLDPLNQAQPFFGRQSRGLSAQSLCRRYAE